MSPRRTRKAAPAAAEAAPPMPEHEFIMKMLRGEIEPIYPPRFDDLGLAPTDAEEDPSGLIESLCGADNSQNVEQYDGTLGVTQAFVASHQGPVGQLQWNNNLATIYTNPGDVNNARWCTGTLISNNLFLTAGHCFDQLPGGWTVPRQNGTMNPIPSTEIATNMHVNFNYQFDPAGNLRPVTSVAVTQLVEYRLAGIDFAIVRLAGTPGTTWGVTGVAAGDAAVGDMLTIIQHPAGVPKRIEAGPLSDFVGNSIRYNDIDTLGGSSGAGILGPAGTIVGVHTNGGCTGAMTGHNFGQRISAVRNASPTIRSLGSGVNFKKALDDPRPSKKVADDPIVVKKPLDDPRPFKKQLDDPRPFKKRVDDPVVLKKPADDPIVNPKGIGDVKVGLDPVDPFRPGPLVGGGGGIGGRTPFILSTPHHAELGGAEAAGGEMGAYEQALGETQGRLQQIEQAIQQNALEAAALQALWQQTVAEFEALAQDYVARGGQA